MDFQNYWYLLMLFVLTGVTIFLFLKKTIVFVLEFKYMLPAILFSGAIFILFNNRLLETGILNYNAKYLSGKMLYHLPVEEWLYILIVSFLSFSVYLLVSAKYEHLGKQKLFLAVSVVILVGVVFLAWNIREKLIPFFISFLLAIYFAYTLFRKRFNDHLAKFYITFLIVAVPFFISKAILNSLPVIIYNNEHVLGIRLLNMPVEEFGILFLIMLINITIFEYLRNNQLY